MTWLRVWLVPKHAESIEAQRAAVDRLLNARVLSGDIEERLREVSHVLAAVAHAEPEERKS